MKRDSRALLGTLVAQAGIGVAGCGGGSKGTTGTGDYVVLDVGEISLFGRKVSVNASGSVATLLESIRPGSGTVLSVRKEEILVSACRL